MVGQNVIFLVHEIFRFGTMFRKLNSNLLILIPKIDSAAVVDKFRPIVLGNFIFKVITRILVDILHSITRKNDLSESI